MSSLPEFSSANRISALYSDNLAQRKHADPAAYASVVAFWLRTIPELLRQVEDDQVLPDKLVLHVDEKLWTALRWNKVGKPWPLASAIVGYIPRSMRTLL